MIICNKSYIKTKVFNNLEIKYALCSHRKKSRLFGAEWKVEAIVVCV